VAVVTEDAELGRLAALLRVRNAIDREIATVLGKSPTPGNLGEFIASRIFDIKLAPTGVNPGHDGWFQSGPFAGKSVNVKLYSEDAGLLDIGQHPADYYLVLTGPRPAPSSGPRSLPRRIDAAYLFDIAALRASLSERGVGIGIATSVRKQYWQEAQICPAREDGPLQLTPQQVELLGMFSAEA
jgi:hypothetical protein